ncbi:hypothetical protein BGZ58_002333 [Dissophora ornata]|nr:hypothetical protein BGZ58_002333 [Dissophora ornata]
MLTDPASLENNYRVLPLLIGCIVPVSILINVPSITSPWVGTAIYNETTKDWEEIEAIQIPHWISAMIILALIMAIICNICVLLRFLERHVWRSVILSLITATLQDALCIGAIVPFCVLYPPHKGFVYLEGFWTMIASMVFSFTATVLMSIDLHRTPFFRLQGSGVTPKQRILIAEAMALCFYLAVGAMAYIYVENWTFLDALFFVMVTITTIGFGDRVPKTTGGRVLIIFYASGGIVLLAMVINSIRYVILEDLHRQFAIRAKERKASRLARRLERKEQRTREEEHRQRLHNAMERLHRMESEGGIGRLNSNEDTHTLSRYFTHFPRHFGLSNGNQVKLPSMFTRNPEATENKQVEGAEDQGGHHSDTTLDGGPNDNSLEETRVGDALAPERVDTGVTLQDQFDYERQRSTSNENNTDDELLRYATMRPAAMYLPEDHRPWWRRILPSRRKTVDIAPTHTPTMEEQREADKKQAYNDTMKEYRARLRFSAVMLLSFWVVGAVIFKYVESWDFGTSMYFVFIAFSTIGYGEYVPRTLAGRAIFLAYCLLGVATLTSLASMISEVLGKRMRKHVVETHLRRAERLGALEETDYPADHLDLEAGISNDQESVLPCDERVHVLHGLVDDAPVEPDASSTDSSCRGSLQKLVKVSKDFDHLLQKMLGLNRAPESNQASVHRLEPSRPPLSTPGAIVEYLEKEEDASDRYLSPSISRDITSASSIHRGSLRPSMHLRRHSSDQHVRTYHGPSSVKSSSDGNQFKITAWPTSGASTTGAHLPDTRRNISPSPSPSIMSSMLPVTSSVSSYRHNKAGTITVAAIDWNNLIEYAKQFKALTEACEESLLKIAAWEASQKKLRERRFRARIRQKKLLEERRRQLEEQEVTRGEDDLEQEDELDELEDWDEEGSNDDEEDEALDRRRGRIVTSLLGATDRRSLRRSQSRGRRDRLSTVSRVCSRQEDDGEDEDEAEDEDERPGANSGLNSNSNHLQHPHRAPSSPISLSAQLQARLKGQRRKNSSKRQWQSTSHARDHNVNHRHRSADTGDGREEWRRREESSHRRGSAGTSDNHRRLSATSIGTDANMAAIQSVLSGPTAMAAPDSGPSVSLIVPGSILVDSPPPSP